MFLAILLPVLILIATVLGAIGTKVDKKQLVMYATIASGVVATVVSIVQAIQQSQSGQKQEKFEQELREKNERMEYLIASVLTSVDTKNQDAAKLASEILARFAASNSESARALINAAETNPATAKTVSKAIGLSPSLGEAIRQVDPSSPLLPEDKTVSSGSANIRRGGYGTFELKIDPNTTLVNGLSGESYQYVGVIFKPGDQINLNFGYNGIDVGSGSAIINGRKYEKIFYGGTIFFNAGPVTVPSVDTPTLTISTSCSVGGPLLGLSKSSMVAEVEDQIFHYRLNGEGIATIELAKDPTGGYYLIQVMFQF
jgi:hypothetical protein